MKKLLIGIGVLIALLLVAFFVVTSSGFLKSMVLPRVGAALNARVEAESISLSPFSSVEIRRLTITPNGAEQLASIEVARVRYSLTAILGGKIAVDEILVGTPKVTLVQQPDGTSNLDPILRQFASTPAATPAQPATPGKPIQLDLKSFKVENAVLGYRATARDGAQTSAEVTGLTLSAQNLRNGGNGRLEVAAAFKFDQRGSGLNPTNSGVEGTVQGGFDVGLSPELMPGTVGGRLESQIRQASGAFREFQGFSTVVSADLAPGDLKRLGVEFLRQGTTLGAVSARGPLDLARQEAKLQVEVTAIDRNVLNLFGAALGLDFTTSRFDSTNRIEVAAGGKSIAVVGGVTGTRVAVKKGDLVMPPVDLRKTYDLSVDLTGQSATIRAFSLSGSQGGREIVRGTLSQPMQVSWAAQAGPLPEAALKLVVSDLRLGDWSALAGTPLQGSFSALADLGVKNAGKDLQLEATSSLTGFSGTFGSNVVRNLGSTATLKVAVAAFADAAQRRLKAAVEVKDLSGEAAVVKFERYGLQATADLGLPEGEVVIHDLRAQFQQGTQQGGSVEVKGRWNTVRGAGDLTVAARDINENALRPFLQAALGDKTLRSVRLTADLSTKIDPAADVSVKATADVKDLVVRDPSGTVPETPLAAGISLDASGSAQKVVIRQGEVRLTPTARAKNVATLTGDLDMSRTNALKGAFKLAAESLDVTPFFDLFAAAPAPAAGQPVPATPPPAAGPMQEPAAVQLPIESLTFDASVGKFYLREVAAENFVAALKITGSRIEIQPLQFSLNGAPIKAGLKLNLGVPGYEYDLAFDAGGVPVKPLANSFVPMLKDRIEGSITAGAEVKGAGLTGVNLQKHLVGGLNFAVTNANLKLTTASNQKSGILTMLVTLLANSLNIRELKDQPIMDIVATAKLGGGKIELTEARARSASLEVGSKGTIPIANDLMQSPVNFPVNVALFRELATRARLVGTNVATNVAYVPLPAIASLKGTLGAPVAEVDKVQTGLLLARGVGGLLGGQAGNSVTGVADLVDGVARGDTNAVGNLIQGLGGLLGGNKNKTTTPATSATPAAGGTNAAYRSGVSTNAAPTNAPPPSTNAAAKTSAPTNASPANALGGLLKGLLEKKP